MTGEVFFGKSIIKKAGQWSRLILLQEASSEVRKSKTLSDQTGLFEGRVEGCRQGKSFECLKDRRREGYAGEKNSKKIKMNLEHSLNTHSNIQRVIFTQLFLFLKDF